MFSLKDVKYKEILDVPNLEIASGEISCLLGPSGCGKTTLLRILNGMISPDAGTIIFHKENLSSLDLVSLRRKVVTLSQQSSIFPGSVKENLNIAAEFQELPAFSDESLLSILKQTGLGAKKLDENPQLFSGGEKQRLSLGRVLLLSPPVLLLDEPGSALDAATEIVIMDLIAADQKRRRSTCVIVTHSEEMARKYSHTIVHMNHGRVTHTEKIREAGK